MKFLKILFIIIIGVLFHSCSNYVNKVEKNKDDLRSLSDNIFNNVYPLNSLLINSDSFLIKNMDNNGVMDKLDLQYAIINSDEYHTYFYREDSAIIFIQSKGPFRNYFKIICSKKNNPKIEYSNASIKKVRIDYDILLIKKKPSFF